MNTLLHICCAPCANQCIEVLRGDKLEVTGFWYNPNIHPFTGEYSLVDGAINSPVLNADLVDFSTDDDTFQASVVSCSVSYTATTITAKVKVKYTRYGSTLGSTTKTIRVV